MDDNRKKTAEEPLARAKRLAAEYLKNPHSEKELRDKLRQKGCAEADIDAAAALCLDYGFLDDGEYAAMIGRRCAAMGYGPGRMRSELKRRGVAPEHWDRAEAELPQDTETIDRLLAARLRGKDPTDRKERDKAAAALFRRGYGWDDIRAALRRYGVNEEE